MTTLPTSKIEWEGNRYTVKQAKDLLSALSRENELYSHSAVCSVCGKFLPESKFYRDASPNSGSKKYLVCKDCLRKVFYQIGADGVEHEPTKESLIDGLKLMNRPFKQGPYDRALLLMSSNRKYDLISAYLRYLNTDSNFYDLTYGDSDNFLGSTKTVEGPENIDDQEVSDVYKQLEIDRADTIRLVGYDPFIKEDYSDQPFLYSQLLGILDSDDDASEDQIRIQSAISITRMFLQNSKIDDSLAGIMQNPDLIRDKATDLNKLQDTKAKIQSSITKLAAESCISLKNAKGGSKSDNTWTGKIKKCKDLSLRAAENNGYDLKTCKGMRQVAEISANAIIKALKLDESDYSDMLADQRVLLTQTNYRAMKLEEAFRILLRENLDLKELIQDNGIEIDMNLVDLDGLLESVDEEPKDA